MTRAKGKKVLQGLVSNVSPVLNYRGVKVVVPRCQIPKLVLGKTEYTTGPCQQAVKDDRSLKYTWYKTCTHGPELDEDGNTIPEELRPYYETNIVVDRKPIVEAGAVKGWDETTRYQTKLRIRDIAWSRGIMGGFSVRAQILQGAMDPAEFDIAQFCEMHGCMVNDPKRVKKYNNGYFCSDKHAKLVKASETGLTLHMPIHGAQTDMERTSDVYQEEMSKIDV